MCSAFHVCLRTNIHWRSLAGGWVQMQPGVIKVSASVDKFLPALLPTSQMPHTLPWPLEEGLSHWREVETLLIWTLQRKPSPLTSSCPKQCWCGNMVLKGLPGCFDPGASGQFLFFQAWGILGPLALLLASYNIYSFKWLLYLFSLIPSKLPRGED